MDYPATKALAGPALSVAETLATVATRPLAKRWETDFTKFSNLHWKNTTERTDPERANYYDRAFIYYVQHLRSGKKVHRNRANQIARAYMNDYVIANNYGVASWMSFPRGLVGLYEFTGNKKALRCIGAIADNMVNPWNTENNWKRLFDPAQSEGREQARVLEALVCAKLVDAKSIGVPNIQPNGEDWGVTGGNDWVERAKSLVEKALTSGWQKADGSRPNFVEGKHNGQGIDKPFMNGLFNNALIQFYESIEPDQRIVPFLAKNAAFMWANEWDEAAQAFQYFDKMPTSGKLSGDSNDPAPDLNMIIAPTYSWLFKMTGESHYLDKTRAIARGGIEKNWLEGGKQFNQQYSYSARVLHDLKEE